MKRRDFMVSATAAALTTASRTRDATDAPPGGAAQVTWTRQVPVRYETDVRRIVMQRGADLEV